MKWKSKTQPNIRIRLRFASSWTTLALRASCRCKQRGDRAAFSRYAVRPKFAPRKNPSRYSTWVFLGAPEQTEIEPELYIRKRVCGFYL